MQCKAKIMAKTAILAVALACAAAPASAQEKAKAKADQPFNVVRMSQSDGQRQLEAAIRISLASRSCKLETPLADKDDARLTGFINALTKKLRLDPNRLERVYYVKSFDEYEKDEAKFCSAWAPQIADYVKRVP